MLSSVREQLRILLEVCIFCFNMTKYSSNILVKNMFLIAILCNHQPKFGTHGHGF